MFCLTKAPHRSTSLRSLLLNHLARTKSIRKSLNHPHLLMVVRAPFSTPRFAQRTSHQPLCKTAQFLHNLQLMATPTRRSRLLLHPYHLNPNLTARLSTLSQFPGVSLKLGGSRFHLRSSSHAVGSARPLRCVKYPPTRMLTLPRIGNM